MGITFSRENFESTLKDIEKYLGYLRGNENAWKYIEKVRNESEAMWDEGLLYAFRLDPDYSFPCDDGRFKVHPERTQLWHIYIPADATFNRDPFVKAVQQSADMAFEDGIAWARGVADYCRSVCDQFLKPDVPTLVDTILALQRDVVTPLQDAPNDDWANLGNFRVLWTGEAADEFNNFYDNYNDVLARDAIFTHLVNVGFCSATRVISSTQFGAQFFLDSIRDILVAQLEQWSRWDREPIYYDADLPPWVADLKKVAESAFEVASDYIPALGEIADIKGKVENVSALVNDIEELTGKDVIPKLEKTIPVKTAEDIYKGLTTTLYDNYLNGYQDAMTALQQGGTGGDVPDPSELTTSAFSGAGVVALMREDQQQGDWDLPAVSNGDLEGNANYY